MPTLPRLVPFAPAHAEAVLGWVESAGELAAWCGRTDFPPGRTVFAEWHAETGVHPYFLIDDSHLAAYGEIWDGEGEAELARIIVAPDHRGRGVGRMLVRLLAREARLRGFDDIWLRALPTNAAALACYGGAGFRRAGPAMEQEFNRAQPVSYVWMKLAAAGTVRAPGRRP